MIVNEDGLQRCFSRMVAFEIPSDAMEAAETDPEQGEEDHAGLFVAFRGKSIERREVCSTGSSSA